MKVLLDSGTSTLPNAIQVQASSIIIPEPGQTPYIYFYGINSNNFDITKSNIKVWNLTKGNWAYGGDSIVTPGNLTVTYNDGTPQFTLELIPFDLSNPPFDDGDNTKVTIEVPDQTGLYSISTNEYKSFPEFGKSAVCYSVRLVNASYTGPCMKVRRSNDNATSDIPFSFTPDGRALDETALLNFVGSNSAFIDTWYDQSGNGRNAVQATTANQPRIVNSGTIDRINTRPTVLFDGVSDSLSISDTSIGQNVGYLSTYQVVKWTAVPTASRTSFSLATGVIANPRFITQGTTTSKLRFATRRLDADAISNLDTTANITTNPTLFFSQATYTVPSVQTYTNGTLSVQATPAYGAGSTANVASAGIRIGSSAAGGSQYFNGSMSEFILFNTAIPSYRIINMNVSITSYYGIS